MKNKKATDACTSLATSTAKKAKKTAIVVIVSVLVAFICLYVAAYALAERLAKDEEYAAPTFSFYEADYDLDIFSLKEYLDLDRQFYFTDPATGRTTGIPDMDTSSLGEYSAPVDTVFEYLNCAINGDADGLNALFSENYLSENGKKADFTMQQLYNISVTAESSETKTENGVGVKSYTFSVEYTIRMNNGTFRNDVGSSGSKAEHVTVVEHGGKYLIDSVKVYRVYYKK